MTRTDPFGAASLAKLAKLCAADPYFVEQAQGFDARIWLRRDGETGWLQISAADGAGTSAITVTTGDGEPDSWAVGIAGTAEQWEEIWSGLPGGLHRAWRQKLLEFFGPEEALLAHYPMVWQLGELMVTTGWSA